MSNSSEEEYQNLSWMPQQTQQQQQLHQHFIQNYSEPTAFGQSRPQAQHESFSVLPVGQGNFLKVYHTMQQQNEPLPNNYNNYELFGGNGGNSAGCNEEEHLQVRADQQQQQQHQQQFLNNAANTTNMINHLVTNWSPNLTGNNYAPTFSNVNFERNLYQQQYPLSTVAPTAPQPQQQPHQQQQQREFQTIRPLSKSVNSKTNGSFENNAPSFAPEVKKRIVAEVKPMRMSYSDVLSKSNNKSDETENAFVNPQNKSVNKSINRQNTFTFERKPLVNGVPLKSMENTPKIEEIPKKRSPVHENSIAQKNSAKKAPKTTKKTNTTTATTESAKKKSKKSESTDESSKKPPTKNSVSIEDKDEGFYNVTKTESVYERPQKSTYSSNRKSRHSGISSSKTNSKNTNFSSKRNTNSSRKDYHHNNSNNPNRIQMSDLLNALLNKILENSFKILSWLFYLVYDIVVLGFSMAYERMYNFYSISSVYCKNVYKDLKQNSDKPSIWLKITWKRFDTKFKKNSKWAFWRKFHKKKPPEHTSDFYKNGRLPQTGEEAMYSLLNCKGKDAYSILGVTADSSQEQIRKHYKKIAVLVHPDKNKQAGAEEAFKVLRRAFELIGEPENRQAYDRSLLEALNAEKAWSELHDLLSQLQTKISEAANTIRCSSCGLRHPRKLTDRAQYAARECNSCKIRHPAKEGDIWAETSCFGLRWKYLALMETKVYDITEWANCQKGALSHLQPNSHIVQYRIVRGGQQQQQQQNNHSANSNRERDRFRREHSGEPTLDDFLDNLYSGQTPHGGFPNSTSNRRRTRRN